MLINMPSMIGSFESISWDKLTNCDMAVSPERQLHEYYDSVFYAKYPSGWLLEIAWFPPTNVEHPAETPGTFQINVFVPSEEWKPLHVFNANCWEEFLKQLKDAVHIIEQSPPPLSTD